MTTGPGTIDDEIGKADLIGQPGQMQRRDLFGGGGGLAALLAMALVGCRSR